MYTNLDCEHSADGCFRLVPFHLRAKAIPSTSPPVKKTKKYFNKTNPKFITYLSIRKDSYKLHHTWALIDH